jgi:hypothetical protein
MKKIFKVTLSIIGILLLIIIAAAVILPLAYKGKIVEYAKSEANTKINAKLDFDNDISLSLFNSFPDFSIGIKGLRIINNSPFEGDTLVSMQDFKATLDIMSVLKGEKIQVRNIVMNTPRINLHVLKDGRSNWDIALPNKDTLAKQGKDTASKFKMGLKHYEINHAHIVYNDQQGNMYAMLDDMTHTGSGDFTKDVFGLDTKTTIERTTYDFGGVRYLSVVRSRLDAKFNIDNAKSVYTLKDNEMQLNDLVMDFGGMVAMPGKDINMDMTFKSKKTEFKSLLSLIPSIYKKDFSKLRSSGNMTFSGNVKGTYNDKSMPGFNVILNVANGMFQYPDLPSPVQDVNIDMRVNNPGGANMNGMVIDIKKAHFAMANEPFDMHMIVRTPTSDPDIDGAIKGKIVLENLDKVIKLDPGTTASGLLDADLSMKGHVSTLEQKKYEDFDAKGRIIASNIVYTSKDMPEKISVTGATLTFNPKDVKLSDCRMMLGKSDLKMEGSINNMLGYMLKKNEVLHGSLNMSSDFFDANPWTGGNKLEAQKNTEAKKASAVELPGNVDFTINSVMKEVLYDKWDITNLKGVLVLKDKKLTFNKVGLNMLGAAFTADGFYDSRTPTEPHLSMNLGIKNLSIAETYINFVTAQKFAPIAKNTTGTMDAVLFLDTKLDKEMNPVFSSLNSNGKLDILRAIVSNFLPLKELANQLKMDKLNTIIVKNIHPSFLITNGRFSLKEPLKFDYEQIKGQVTGSNGFDKSLDYVMAMDIPSGLLQQQASSAISTLMGKNVTALPKNITVNALISGTIDHPTVKLSFKDVVNNVVDNLKNQAKAEFDAKKKELEDKAKDEVDKQKKQLEAQKKQAEDQLRQQADQAKKKAEDDAKKQLDEQKAKVKDQAKEKLKGLFGK